MPASATLVGAAMGLGVQFYSNAVRKLPLMRREFTRGASRNGIPSVLLFAGLPPSLLVPLLQRLSSLLTLRCASDPFVSPLLRFDPSISPLHLLSSD
ncbi:unnamed protein product [Closterium sp. NIES-53]